MKRIAKKPITTTTATTPSSSSRSSITTTTTFTFMEPDRSELTKESSSYFPGCKKDANCTCEICLDSHNATLDLKQLTNQKTSTPNLNPFRPSPIPFRSQSLISTPNIRRRINHQWSPISSPCLKSTARVRPKSASASAAAVVVSVEEEDGGRRKRSRFVGFVLIFVLLILGMELGFPYVVSRVFRTELSAEIVRDLGERAFGVEGMNWKLRILERELEHSVNGKVSNCTHNPKAWEIIQDGMFVRSRCVLYKSLMEEVSVWGWPLQTAGLLASRFSSRSFTVLSGRVTQWPEGNAENVTVKARESWLLEKYKACAVKMEAQTWVIEYRRSVMLEQNGLCSAMWKFVEYNLGSFDVWKMRFGVRWMAEAFGGYSDAGDGDGHVHPT